MSYVLSIFEEIHSRALEVATRYKRAGAELIEILQQVEDKKVYLSLGHASLFKYFVTELGLSESTSYTLITVARKSREVPELKTRISSGEITLSNARRISAVLTKQNQEQWLAKATELSSRELEREIVKIYPQHAVPERTSHVAPNRMKLEIGISESAELRLRRAQDLLCQSLRRAVSLEETVEILTSLFLEKNDPLEKAKRVQSLPTPPEKPKHKTPGSSKKLVTKRVAIPAKLHHRIGRRDQRSCTYLDHRGVRCSQTRWIEVHHLIPVSRGGPNTLENLTTLCSAHHRYVHEGISTGRSVTQKV